MIQHISRDDPIICNCNEGKCKWENMADPDAKPESVRADCTRGYEWIKLPIGSGSEYYDKMVDFASGKSGGAIASSAIVVEKIPTSSEFGWNPRLNDNWARRVPIEPIQKNDTNGSFESPRGGDAYALTTQCELGDMEWVDGPYECSEPCGDRDESCFNDGWGGFQCAGSPRKVFHE